MPIIKSAKKRARQETVRRKRNNQVRRKVREANKAFEAALESGKKADISKELSNLQSVLDTAQKKNLMHKNKVARKMSRYNQRAKDAAGVKKSSTSKTATSKKATAKKSTAKKASTKKTSAKKTTKKS